MSKKIHWLSIVPIAAVLIAGSLAVSPIVIAGDDDDEFKADLTGSEEVPNPVTTDTTGEASFEVDDNTIEFDLEVEDGNLVTRAHIHCAPAGSNGPIVVALLEHKDGGVSTVRLSEDVEIEGTITDESISNDACGATIEELVQSMRDGDTYVNVHTVGNPAGEIRGQIVIDDDDD